MITAAECRKARNALGWDIPALAAAAHVPPLTIHMFEAGQSKPRTATLEKLARTLNDGRDRAPSVAVASADGAAFTPAQCKAARQLLGWDYLQLAEASGCANYTAMAFEQGSSRSRPVTREKLRRTFEAAGVEFIAQNGGGAGVRLRK